MWINFFLLPLTGLLLILTLVRICCLLIHQPAVIRSPWKHLMIKNKYSKNENNKNSPVVIAGIYILPPWWESWSRPVLPPPPKGNFSCPATAHPSTASVSLVARTSTHTRTRAPAENAIHWQARCARWSAIAPSAIGEGEGFRGGRFN